MKLSPRPIPHARAGMTLIELLVVIAIIGVLAAAIMVSLNETKVRAREAKTQSDLSNIADAVEFLVNDTGLLPGALTASQCIHMVMGNEVFLDSTEEGGLHGTGAMFGNWQGPYAERRLIDQWGTSFWFDHDYDCSFGSVGCGMHVGDVQAIVSSGPNRSGLGIYDADNIILIRCAG